MDDTGGYVRTVSYRETVPYRIPYSGTNRIRTVSVPYTVTN
jgi:hypothetical protein